MRTLFRHPGRLWRVLVVFSRYFILPKLPFRSPPEPGAVRMRLAIEELGGAWVKLGQMLAMRFDLLPPAYCSELLKLLGQVRPFSYDEVRSIVTAELGAPPEEVFASFEQRSFAAASIGQVHRAVLPTGERVAVKVQRPGIRADFRSDIGLMYAAGGFIDRSRLFGATKSRQVIDEFARWTADELDYLVEARQAALLHEHAEGERLERIARVYRDYTTSRVLTSELIEGISLYEVMVASRDGDADYLATLRARGYDPDVIVRNLDWNMLNQVFVHGYFHADLHPANLFVLPANAIGYVDYGIVGSLPDDTRDSLTHYSWLLFHGDVDAAVKELMRWLAPTTTTDPEAARSYLVSVHRSFVYEMGASDADAGGERPADAAAPAARPARANPYSRLAMDTMRGIREHSLAFSPGIVAYLKMLVMLGTIRHELAIEYDLRANVRRFFTRYMRQRALALADPRLATERLYEASIRIRRTLRFVEFIESQEPFIVEAQSSLLDIRRRMKAIRGQLVRIGVAVLLVGGALYFVLADPGDTRRMLPAGVDYALVHYGLVILLVLLVARLVLHMRKLDDSN
jgi:ubiquinone biosynthesis protein